ncbi:MAG TPA: hypothetical protein VHT91_39325 [Kofleriaceae bacterium]|nr:hypothetical protein [Kofleriaceae bacterium]
MRDGLLVKVPEKVAFIADGQRPPPVVVTGTVSLENATDELVLLQGFETVVAAPEVVVQWVPPMVAVATTPPAGIFSSPVGPLFARQNCHAPFVLFDVIVAVKFRKPPILPVHPVKVGLLMFAQTGVPEAVEPLGVVPLADDPVQVTVAAPTVKVTWLDDAVKLVFCGVTVSANARWAPTPITAASAGAAR